MADGPLPGDRFSLGREACRWIESSLAVPDGPRYGHPVRLSRRQAKFLVDLFMFEWSGTGWLRVYDRAFYVGPKGEGKSPLAAFVAAFVAIGPSVPSDVDGKWLIGARDPSALVQIFANSEAQGKRVIWAPLTACLKGGRLAEDVFVGKTMIECGGSSFIFYEAASAASAEGPRVNAVIAEETQFWRDRDMRELWEAIVRNTGKKEGFVLAPTNAPLRGDRSVADEQIRMSERGGPEAESLLMLFPKALSPVADLRGDDAKPSVMAALAEVYGEAADPTSGWVNLESVYRRLVGGKEHLGRRFFLNESGEASGRLVRSDRFDSLARPGVKIPAGQFVVLGFDGSESDDATALVAASCTDPPHVETVGVWHRPPGVARGDYRIPKGEVRAALELCRERWRVEALIGDPSVSWVSFFEDFADQWGQVSPANLGDHTTRAGWGLVCQVWMNSPSITHAVVSHFIGLLDGEASAEVIADVGAELPGDGEVTFTHDADSRLIAHTKAMVRTEAKNGRFVAVGKESDGDEARIDAGVALMLALWGTSRFEVHAEGDVRPVGTGAGSALMDRLRR